MINNSSNPAEWALLIYELDDACEHIATLSKQMTEQGAIDREDFAISLDIPMHTLTVHGTYVFVKKRSKRMNGHRPVNIQLT